MAPRRSIYRDRYGRFARRPPRKTKKAGRPKKGRKTKIIRPRPIRGKKIGRRKYIPPTITRKTLSRSQIEDIASRTFGVLLDPTDPYDRHLLRDRPLRVSVAHLAYLDLVDKGYIPGSPSYQQRYHTAYRRAQIKIAAQVLGLRLSDTRRLFREGIVTWATIEEMEPGSP